MLKRRRGQTKCVKRLKRSALHQGSRRGLWHHLSWLTREKRWTLLSIGLSGGEGIRENPRPFFPPIDGRVLSEMGVKHSSTKMRCVFGGKAAGWQLQHRIEINH